MSNFSRSHQGHIYKQLDYIYSDDRRLCILKFAQNKLTTTQVDNLMVSNIAHSNNNKNIFTTINISWVFDMCQLLSRIW